jgi:hypothetical protein
MNFSLLIIQGMIFMLVTKSLVDLADEHRWPAVALPDAGPTDRREGNIDH